MAMYIPIGRLTTLPMTFQEFSPATEAPAIVFTAKEIL
jgi:hypothetical protein